MITLGNLNDVPGIRHGFFTREGGVSKGIFASLNCGFGSGDAAEDIARNRAIALEILDLAPEALVTGYQTHSRDVAVVERPWRENEKPRVDALVTRTRGIALGILTADCVPVLLADSKAGVIGAAHAGWCGAKAGVIKAVVEQMCALGARPENIAAGLGPAIAYRSYEVGPEFPEKILGAPITEKTAASERRGDHDLFSPAARPGHFMFDLTGYVARRLAEAGVVQADRLPNDTFQEEQRFFSYRRAVLRAEQNYGRCLSAIVLKG